MTHHERSAPAAGPGSSCPHGEAGFSILELVAVFAVVAILVGISVLAFMPHRRAYAPDDLAIQLADFVRDANQRAIAQRQTMRVEVDRTARAIRLVDESGAGAETVVREEQLLEPRLAKVSTPATNPPPKLPSPHNYADASFSGDVWKARFLSNGTMVDMSTAPAPLSATFHVWPPAGGVATATGPNDPSDVRVVTVFGPTAQARIWRHDGTQWVRR